MSLMLGSQAFFRVITRYHCTCIVNPPWCTGNSRQSQMHASAPFHSVARLVPILTYSQAASAKISSHREQSKAWLLFTDSADILILSESADPGLCICPGYFEMRSNATPRYACALIIPVGSSAFPSQHVGERSVCQSWWQQVGLNQA